MFGDAGFGVRDPVARTGRCWPATSRAGASRTTDDGAPQVRGLLDDQIAMADAQLDAFEATGNVVYQMMAEELAHYALRTMWDERMAGSSIAAGGSTRAIGLMRDRLKPFAANCDASGAVRRRRSRAAGRSPSRDGRIARWPPFATTRPMLAARGGARLALTPGRVIDCPFGTVNRASQGESRDRLADELHQLLALR